MDTSSFVCPNCGSITAPDDVFCSHCGAQLTRNVSVGIGKQIWIYFVSFALPPLGLIWVFKYIHSQSPDKKRIAYIALGLTIVGILLTLWTLGGVLQGMQQQVNSYSSLGL